MISLCITMTKNLLFFYEAFLLTEFLLRFSPCRYEANPKQILAVQTMAMAVLSTWSDRNVPILIFMIVIYIPDVLLFSVLCLKGTLRRRFLGSFLAIGVKGLATLAAVVITIRSADLTPVELEYDWYRAIIMLLAGVLQGAAFELILRASGRCGIRMKPLEKGIMISNLITSSLAFSFIHLICYGELPPEYRSYLYLLSLLCLVIINCISFRLMGRLNRENELASDNRMLRQSVMYYENHLHLAQEQFEELKQLRHDIRHSYQLIGNLACQGKNEEIGQYICEVLDIVDEDCIVMTGNGFVDSMLSCKLSYAQKKGIRISHSVTTDLAGLENVDCCSLIGNLIDNGTEAAMKVAEERRYLELEITGDACKLLVRVRNAARPGGLMAGGFQESDKEDKELHGYGLKIIRRIAAQYHGCLEISEEEGGYCAEVLLFRRTGSPNFQPDLPQMLTN